MGGAEPAAPVFLVAYLPVPCLQRVDFAGLAVRGGRGRGGDQSPSVPAVPLCRQLLPPWTDLIPLPMPPPSLYQACSESVWTRVESRPVIFCPKVTWLLPLPGGGAHHSPVCVAECLVLGCQAESQFAVLLGLRFWNVIGGPKFTSAGVGAPGSLIPGSVCTHGGRPECGTVSLRVLPPSHLWYPAFPTQMHLA